MSRTRRLTGPDSRAAYESLQLRIGLRAHRTDAHLPVTKKLPLIGNFAPTARRPLRTEVNLALHATGHTLISLRKYLVIGRRKRRRWKIDEVS
jgi:hypothetical protein